MQLEALEIFCDVARYRSFSQAALVNQVTQSAVSQMVAQLEERLKVQLIDRSTRPLQLTALGKAYYEGCKAILEQYSELEASVRSAQASVEGSVQIAAIYSVGLGDMDQYIQTFHSQQPDAEVHIEYCHPNQVYEKVLDSSADLGLVSFPRKSSKLTITHWRDEPMVLACSPGHALAKATAVDPAALDGMRYIHFSKDLVIRREVDRFLRSQKVSVEVVHEFDNVENIKKAVEYAAGVALLPEPTFRKEVSRGELMAVPLAGSLLARPLGIIQRRHHKLSQAAQGFLHLLCQGRPLPPPDDASNGVSANGAGEVPSAARSGKRRNGHSAPKPKA